MIDEANNLRLDKKSIPGLFALRPGYEVVTEIPVAFLQHHFRFFQERKLTKIAYSNRQSIDVSVSMDINKSSRTIGWFDFQ